MKRIVIGITLLCLAGCGPEGFMGIGKASPPPAGSAIDAKFWKDFMKPELKPGRTWTYVGKKVTSNFDVVTSERTYRVDTNGEIVGDPEAGSPGNRDLIEISLAMTIGVLQMAIPNSPSDLGQYQSDGSDDLTVPAGKFNGAAKISRKIGGETSWYYPGVGLIKRDALGVVMELKSYTK